MVERKNIDIEPGEQIVCLHCHISRVQYREHDRIVGKAALRILGSNVVVARIVTAGV